MNDNFHTLVDLPISFSLEQVQQRFESWRQRRKKTYPHPPKPMGCSCCAITRAFEALRVNCTALKKQVIKPKDTEPSRSEVCLSTFIELPAPAAPFNESTLFPVLRPPASRYLFFNTVATHLPEPSWIRPRRRRRRCSG